MGNWLRDMNMKRIYWVLFILPYITSCAVQTQNKSQRIDQAEAEQRAVEFFNERLQSSFVVESVIKSEPTWSFNFRGCSDSDEDWVFMEINDYGVIRNLKRNNKKEAISIEPPLSRAIMTFEESEEVAHRLLMKYYPYSRYLVCYIHKYRVRWNVVVRQTNANPATKDLESVGITEDGTVIPPVDLFMAQDIETAKEYSRRTDKTFPCDCSVDKLP
jgi:hypothetical protein